MSQLTQRRCVPCEAGVPPLTAPQISLLAPEVPAWTVSREPPRLERRFKLKDFRAAIAFVNRIADVAEAEDHHPDIAIHYNVVEITLWTHVMGGLSENDFILAAKIDALGVGA